MSLDERQRDERLQANHDEKVVRRLIGELDVVPRHLLQTSSSHHKTKDKPKMVGLARAMKARWSLNQTRGQSVPDPHHKSEGGTAYESKVPVCLPGEERKPEGSPFHLMAKEDRFQITLASLLSSRSMASRMMISSVLSVTKQLVAP